MAYILMEIQTTDGNTAVLPPLVYTDRKEAESAYHSKLAYAAQSTCDVHTVSLLDIYGCAIRAEHYDKEEAEV